MQTIQKNAIAAPPTDNEISEAVAIGIEFGWGPSFVIVRDYFQNFLEELRIEKNELK